MMRISDQHTGYYWPLYTPWGPDHRVIAKNILQIIPVPPRTINDIDAILPVLNSTVYMELLSIGELIGEH